MLQLPLSRISVEMVVRSLYFYVQALDQGYGGSAASYLAREAKELGIIKRLRPPNRPTLTEQIRLALVAPPLAAGP